jgi:hypothetical protein
MFNILLTLGCLACKQINKDQAAYSPSSEASFPGVAHGRCSNGRCFVVSAQTDAGPGAIPHARR